MKVIFYAFRAMMALIFLYVSAPSIMAQDPDMAPSEMEIPISTVSETAMQKYIEGRTMRLDFQTAKALALFNEAIELDPDFALAYAGIALTIGDYEEVVKNIDKAVGLSADASSGEKYYIKLIKADIDNDIIGQQENLTKLIELYPSDKEVMFIAGSFKYADGDYDECAAYLKKAVAIDSKYAPAYNMLGYSYAGLNNYAEAEKALMTYLELKPGLPNAYDSYAEILRLEGKYDESITQYNLALEKDPQFAFSLQGLGDCYCLKKDFGKARECYRKLYKLTENYNKYNALYNISLSYVREGNIKEALNVLDKRAKTAEENGDMPAVTSSLNAKGFILAESGEPNKAVTAFKTALDKINNSALSDDAKKNIITGIKLNVIYGMVLQNRLDDSKKKLNDIEQTVLSSNNLDDIRMLNFINGAIALKEGNAGEAIDYFARAGNDNPLAWRYGAVAFHKKGDYAKAIELRDKIQTFNQNTLTGALAAYNFQDLAELEPE